MRYWARSTEALILRTNLALTSRAYHTLPNPYIILQYNNQYERIYTWVTCLSLSNSLTHSFSRIECNTSDTIFTNQDLRLHLNRHLNAINTTRNRALLLLLLIMMLGGLYWTISKVCISVYNIYIYICVTVHAFHQPQRKFQNMNLHDIRLDCVNLKRLTSTIVYWSWKCASLTRHSQRLHEYFTIYYEDSRGIFVSSPPYTFLLFPLPLAGHAAGIKQKISIWDSAPHIAHNLGLSNAILHHCN